MVTISLSVVRPQYHFPKILAPLVHPFFLFSPPIMRNPFDVLTFRRPYPAFPPFLGVLVNPSNLISVRFTSLALSPLPFPRPHFIFLSFVLRLGGTGPFFLCDGQNMREGLPMGCEYRFVRSFHRSRLRFLFPIKALCFLFPPMHVLLCRRSTPLLIDLCPVKYAFL